MKTFTLPLNDSQFLILKEMTSELVERFRDSYAQRAFTVPEMIEIRALYKKLLEIKPSAKKGKNRG